MKVHLGQEDHQNSFLGMNHIEHRCFLRDNLCKQQDDHRQDQWVHQHRSHQFYDMQIRLDMGKVDNRPEYRFEHHRKIHQDIVRSYYQWYHAHIDKHLNIYLDL